MLSFSLDKEIRTDVSANDEPLSFSCSNMSDIEALFDMLKYVYILKLRSGYY